jgi:hypothetical protein
MKVAVYLANTAELLGVVDCDAEVCERMRHGGYWRLNSYRLTPLAAYSPTTPINDVLDIIEYQAVPIYASGGQTFYFVVQKREHLECWSRQLWPRRRSRNHKESKLPKADRRQRAQAQGPQYRLTNPNVFRR